MLVAFEMLPPPVISDRESQKTSCAPLPEVAFPLISVEGLVGGLIVTLESFSTTRPLRALPVMREPPRLACEPSLTTTP